MSKKVTNIKTLKLAHTKKGTISVAHIEEPYGEFSSPVTSISISIDGESEDWRVHIPYENIDELVKSLNEAHDFCKTIPHNPPHTTDLSANTGGGL